jgi:uncharacterized protein YciI
MGWIAPGFGASCPAPGRTLAGKWQAEKSGKQMFVVHCKDRPGAAGLRQETRSAHLDYLKDFHARIVVAGPVTDPEGQTMIGSLLVMDFADRADLDAFLAGDPYAKAGLFESVTILPFKKVLP